MTVDYLTCMVYNTSISNGQDPVVLLYNQNAMRKHIINSIKDGVVTAFPSAANRYPKSSVRKNIPVYCNYICRHINYGSKMIQCDICHQLVVPWSLPKIAGQSGTALYSN